MKVIGVVEYGGPDALRVFDVPEPHAGPGQVRIRVHAAGVNPTDTLIRDGSRAEAQKVVASYTDTVQSEAHLAGPDPDARGELGLGGMGVTVDGRTAIIDAHWRERVTIVGRVRSLRVAPQHDAPTLELVLTDDTGAISVVFLGRRSLAGVEVGSRMVVEGTVGVHRARLALLNPSYRLVV